jgi:hypothetical protein
MPTITDPTAARVVSPGIGLRVRVRLRRCRLDRELAQGLGCEDSEARSLRARQLATARTRRRLARSARWVAESDPARLSPLFSPPQIAPTSAVYSWREAFAGLAERLESSAPINVCGIARLTELLADGAGPLYNHNTEARLGDVIWWVADGLEAE